jgi:hypothetical protein
MKENAGPTSSKINFRDNNYIDLNLLKSFGCDFTNLVSQVTRPPMTLS